MENLDSNCTRGVAERGARAARASRVAEIAATSLFFGAIGLIRSGWLAGGCFASTALAVMLVVTAPAEV